MMLIRRERGWDRMRGCMIDRYTYIKGTLRGKEGLGMFAVSSRLGEENGAVSERRTGRGVIESLEANVSRWIGRRSKYIPKS